MSHQTVLICHLYPDLLNLYGDRGNMICLQQRLAWRGIPVEVQEVPVGAKADLTQCDLVFIGGGQDFEQEVLLPDLQSGKDRELKPIEACSCMERGMLTPFTPAHTYTRPLTDIPLRVTPFSI